MGSIFEEKVKRFCLDYSLFLPDERVLVALSGGVDSMVLLHILLELLGQDNLVAMHINHCLRGNEAERDCLFVEEACSRWGVPLVVERHSVPDMAKERGLGVEEAARFVRRRALVDAAERFNISRIATGHNLNDHVETMLVKLVQGTGLRGIMGISPRQGPFVRPLLGVSRKEILDYAEKKGIPFVEDSTLNS
jgi:tRNA(Ile)-lysidine synthase